MQELIDKKNQMELNTAFKHDNRRVVKGQKEVVITKSSHQVSSKSSRQHQSYLQKSSTVSKVSKESKNISITSSQSGNNPKDKLSSIFMHN